MSEAVEAWFNALTPAQREIADAVRGLIRSRGPDLREEVKWGQACYTGNALVCYIQKAKGHVSLGYGQGGLIEGHAGRLEGAGTRMRHVKMALKDGVNGMDEGLLGPMIEQALTLDRRADR